jgi:uncharacterized protein YdeI (BOF family)
MWNSLRNRHGRLKRAQRGFRFESLEVRTMLSADGIFALDPILEQHRSWFDGYLDASGNRYFEESAHGASYESGSEPGAPEIEGAPPFSLGQTFALHSNSLASHTIYLDFDGHVTSGTYWNTSFNNGNDIVTPAYSFEGDSSSFTDNELERIQKVWQRVSEDFLPFDVDVTTEDPGAAHLTNSGGGDTAWGVRVVVGDNTFYSPAGGVAYLNSFTWGSDTPAFVFNTNETGVAEAAGHEVGHALGLYHDGENPGDGEYYFGHGGGTTGWAPLMGASYYQDLTQWSQGEYAGATNTEDDLAIITGSNGFDFRADDHGNVNPAATSLSVANGVNVSGEGIVELNSDLDVFTFTTGAGEINIDVDPFSYHPNLDIQAQLYSSSGTLIATSNPIGQLDSNINVTVSEGEYYLQVSGVGEGSPSSGYSDYGSLGYYSISGTIISTTPPPEADLAGWWTRVDANSKSVEWGDAITLDKVRVKNYGNADSGSFSLQFVLSQDTTLSSDDVVLDLAGGGNSLQHTSIGAENMGPLSAVDLLLPSSVPTGFSGPGFYVLTSIDAFDEVAESDETNNSGQDKIWDYDNITVTDPTDVDLRGWWTRVDAGSEVADWDEAITLDKVRVKNHGTADSGSFSLQFVLSQDTTLSSDDVVLDLVGGGNALAHASIAGNGMGPLSAVDLLLPSSVPTGFSGTDFYVLTSIDAFDEVVETNESNNSGQALIWDHDNITVTDLPDVDLYGWWTRVASDSELAHWGDSITLDKVQVRNSRSEDSGTFNLQFVLSQDTALSSDDVVLDLAGGGNLLQHASIGGNSLGTLTSVDLLLPSTLPTGFSGTGFHILTSIDALDEVTETNENNNSGQANMWDRDAITVIDTADDVDLKGWWTRVDSGSEVASWGDAITLDKVQIRNNGLGSSGEFSLQFVLSQDATLSSDDVVLDLVGGGNSMQHADINAESLGALSSVDLVLPSSMPTGFNGTDFYILTSIDAFDEVTETNENNNSGQNLIWDHDNISVVTESGSLAAALPSDGAFHRHGVAIVDSDLSPAVLSGESLASDIDGEEVRTNDGSSAAQQIGNFMAWFEETQGRASAATSQVTSTASLMASFGDKKVAESDDTSDGIELASVDEVFRQAGILA